MRSSTALAVSLLTVLLVAPIGRPAAHADAAAESPVRAFEAMLREAQAGMDQLVLKYPGRADLESVRRQLKQVADWTRGGRQPKWWEVRKLSFGLIAAREIETLDLLLARKLEALAYFLDHWPRSAVYNPVP